MHGVMFTGGVVLTMDESRPRAEALLVRGNRIEAVGSDDEIRRLADLDDTVIDTAGKAVMPGFNDSHAHIQDAGRADGMISLKGLCKDDLIARVRDADLSLPPGDILIAGDWDYPECPDPHISDLDSVVPDRPVYLIQHSGHAAWVNSAALRLLKINDSTPDWPGGGADRDSDGGLTGILREPGEWPAVRKLWFKMIRDKSVVSDNLETALVRFAGFGITSVQDNTWFPWNLDGIAAAHRRGELTARISCWSFGVIPPMDLWMSLKRYNSDWYSRGPRKLMLDGAFSSHTAWLSRPYDDLPDTVGSGTPAEKVAARVKQASRRGRQLACHSIGDAATNAYVSAVSSTGASSSSADLRHRVEHGQLVDRVDMERAAEAGMVFSCQPFAAADPGKDARLLGPERAARAYPYRSLLDAGVRLAFGSDYPGESGLNPFEAVDIAVNRDSDEALTVEEALACYTTGSSYAEFRENEKGMLRPGYLADIIVVSDDPTRIESHRIRDIRVEATMIDGRFVYRMEGSGSPGLPS